MACVGAIRWRAMGHPADATTEQLATVVRNALAGRYAVPVVRIDGAGVRVPEGNAVVLAREAAVRAGIEPGRVEAIDHDLLPWHEVPADGIRLWRQHGCAGDAAGELVTQLVAGDPAIQVVAGWDGWQLVRTLDGATGWLEPGVELGSGAVCPSSSGSGVEVESFVAEVERLLGTGYAWGGTTAQGIDCSGLVQRAAWRSSRVWLPRHSTALLRVGERVPPSLAGRGDVLVLQRRRDASSSSSDGMPGIRSGPAHAMHVAVATSEVEVVHASRDAWEVVREPMDAVLGRYRVRGVRRIAGSSPGAGG